MFIKKKAWRYQREGNQKEFEEIIQDNGNNENDKTLQIKLKIEQHKPHQKPNRYENYVLLILKLIRKPTTDTVAVC